MPLENRPGGVEGPAPVQTGGKASPHWYHKARALVFIFFCFELGVFLILFPWLDLWQRNYFSSLSPAWSHWWNNAYFRGAVSGLGLVNVAISFSELFRLRRFSRRQPDA